MKQYLCCIYDGVAEAWHTPLCFQSPAQAVRSFGDALTDGKTEFSRHPEDYTLFEMASFDPYDGKIEVLAVPRKLANGMHLREFNEGPVPQLEKEA